MVEFGDALEQYMDEKCKHHFEGEQGVRNLTRIAETLGYTWGGITEMLADNPFLQQAIVDALLCCSNAPQEWTDALESACEDNATEDPYDMDDPAPK